MEARHLLELGEKAAELKHRDELYCRELKEMEDRHIKELERLEEKHLEQLTAL